MKIHSMILWLVAFVILGLVNYGVFQKESLRTEGQLLYLELAPVDPRSLLQGDYMQLNYAILSPQPPQLPNDNIQPTERQPVVPVEIPEDPDAAGRSGKLLIDVNDQHVGTKAVIFEEGLPIGSNQLLLNFRNTGWNYDIGASSYFFQEGQGERFTEAKYAELRVSPQGDILLIGLLDEDLVRIAEK